MEARPGGSYNSICFRGHASAGVPLHSELPEKVQTVSHQHDTTKCRLSFALIRKVKPGPVQKFADKLNHISMTVSLQFQKMVWEVCSCTCVMRCSSQV